MNTASTVPFQPQPHLSSAEQLRAQLRVWNLDEELDVRENAQGLLSVFSSDGGMDWPDEWAPDGDDLFEPFEIANFLERVAQAGQSIRTQDAGGARMIYLSARTVAVNADHMLGQPG